MYQGFTKKLTASLIVATLSGAAFSAHAEQEFDVIVKLKNQNSPFSLSAAKQLNMKASSNPVAYHKAQANLRKSKVNKFVNQMRIQPKFVYANAYYGFSATVNETQMTALQNNPNVEAVYRDVEYQLLDAQKTAFSKNYNSYKKRRKLVEWPQSVPQAPTDTGSLNSSYKGSGQHVYVIDSGIDADHKDIAANMGLSYAPEFCFRPGNSELCPYPYSDDNGHGTHVAGTIGALDNDIDTLGVAPEATIHAVKVCTAAGSCPGSAILAGLNWSVFDMLGHGQPAVANLSLGGGDSVDAGTCTADGYVGSHFVAEAYCNAAHQGMVIVVAAGNSSSDAAEFSPAKFDSTIAVSSYVSYDNSTGEAVFNEFSNWGDGANDWSSLPSGAITIGAPGNAIESLNRTHGNIKLSGTSMASPAVAGGAALVLEKYPQAMDYTALQNVRQILVDNAAIPSSVVLDSDPDSGTSIYPHAEGLLNLEFLDL